MVAWAGVLQRGPHSGNTSTAWNLSQRHTPGPCTGPGSETSGVRLRGDPRRPVPFENCWFRKKKKDEGKKH